MLSKGGVVRRTISALAAGLLALGGAFGLVPANAGSWTSASYASRLVSLVNQAREQHGLPALTVASGTSQVAAAWTAHLDATQSLSHNPDLGNQLETHGSPDWMTYGENVGQGPAGDPDALFQAYMNSTEHRDNILNRAFRFTGVAVVLDGSTAWNTFDFVDSYQSSMSTASTQVKPKPNATARPAPTTHASAPALSAAPVASTHSSAPVGPRRFATTAARRAAPHAVKAPDAEAGPDVARMLGASASLAGEPRTAVLAASVRPFAPALPASSRLTIALAGLLLGFVGMRWWQVARGA